jgi:hypothetical protein
VYPFPATEDILRTAASGLKELGGDLLGVDYAHSVTLENRDSVQSGNNDANGVDNMGGAHCVTITNGDRDRLKPSQWLNDTLVDFWMRW